MKLIFLCLFICLFQFAYGQDVKEEFVKSELVPDILSNPPEELIVVNFPERFVRLGNELTPTEVKSQPEVQWETLPNTYYTFLMVDPDARSREKPELRSFMHWMVVNVPESNITLGETKVEYMSSAPPKNTGLHRYVFLAYEQGEKRDFDEPEVKGNDIEPRLRFSVQDFEKKYGFKGPKAGNFYVAQWDESVA